MKYAVEFKHFEPAPAIRSGIEGLVARIQKKAKNLDSDPVFLRCAVEGVSVHKLYRVSFAPEVPHKTLVAKQRGARRRRPYPRRVRGNRAAIGCLQNRVPGRTMVETAPRREKLRQLKIGRGEHENEDRD